MIKNEHQYRVSTSLVEGFDRAIAAVERDEDKKKNEPYIWELHYKGAKAMKKMVLSEVEEYEALVKHDPSEPVALTIDQFNQLSDLLIKGRIGLKISQKELAELAGLTEEKIKLYEDKDYADASFLDFMTVSTILGIKLKEGVYTAEIDDYCKECLRAIREGDESAKEEKPIAV